MAVVPPVGNAPRLQRKPFPATRALGDNFVTAQATRQRFPAARRLGGPPRGFRVVTYLSHFLACDTNVRGSGVWEFLRDLFERLIGYPSYRSPSIGTT